MIKNGTWIGFVLAAQGGAFGVEELDWVLGAAFELAVSD